MSFEEANEPILVIGAGGVGSKIASDAKKVLEAD
ncbi:MAG: cell division protein FtsZ, partial [Nitrosopumilaceae archaeon]|nr:cell division protein FtsZ [Nitrosopumilaceae archaeon]NIU86154.1 cell division protein FtsZ [Nitrosopumilaceae archaeon]NIV64608.1 cell division protein FtsZ [Nitrosopumilaceae archaeon]NIX60019.1 cell division protein FtsZ [Nitrosopumilaceae archaeon]